MDVFACIRTRREIRAFTKREVPLEAVERILEAGRLSPSSKNTQPWHFIAVRSRETLRKIASLTPTGRHITDASFAIALAMENASMPEVDGARTMQQMMLAAWELGVGSCWVSNFDEDAVKSLLNIPLGFNLLTVIPFGYPLEPRTSRKKKRKPFEEVVHWETFGRKAP